MRRTLAFCCVVLGLFFLPGQAGAEEQFSHPSIWLSVSDKSLVLGLRGQNVGFEFGRSINKTDYSSSNLLDYPVPHNDYTPLGRKGVDSALGFDLLGFVNPLRRLSLYAGVGIYFQDYREVARSNVTGWLYTQSEETAVEAGFSAGIQVFPSETLMLGICTHSVRGTNFQIGMRF